jgi:hypothetical protein
MAGQKMGSPTSPWLPHDLPCFLPLQDVFSGTSGGKVGGKARRRPLHKASRCPRPHEGPVAEPTCIR